MGKRKWGKGAETVRGGAGGTLNHLEGSGKLEIFMTFFDISEGFVSTLIASTCTQSTGLKEAFLHRTLTNYLTFSS